MTSWRRWSIRAALLVVVGGGVVVGAAAALDTGQAAERPTSPLAGVLAMQGPPRDGGVAGDRDSSVPLASGELREAVEQIRAGQAAGINVDLVDGKIRVEVIHELDSAAAARLIESLGGAIEGQIDGLTQALVPVESLVTLEHADGIRYLRPPLQANVPLLPPALLRQRPGEVSGAAFVGEEVGKANAAAWHAAGFNGAGVKVGIIDFFDGGLWDAAQAAGELPEPVGTFCAFYGASCSVWDFAGDHGVAVGEVIHEMAPGADLYLATVGTSAELQAAVDYFHANGVQIVSRSLTSEYDGSGDGTGPIATVVSNAVAGGMAWFNAAGNNASDGVSSGGYGTYWRRQWVDADADGRMEFASGDEYFGFTCNFLNGLRWSDFGSGDVTDYDVYVYDTPLSIFPFYTSLNSQGGSGFAPLEMLDYPCIPGEVDYMVIRLFDAGSGTVGDTLELMANGGLFEYWQNPYSASGPASDSASPGALSIGAVDPPLGTSIGFYSSQGPTNDSRTKPDVSAASCVQSFTLWPDCFDGTSAAAPAAAGAAALIMDAGLATSPSQVKNYLLNNATVDRGAPGSDNVFGRGELILPAPPGTSPGTATPTPTGPTRTPTRTPTSVPGTPTPTLDLGAAPEAILQVTKSSVHFGTDGALEVRARNIAAPGLGEWSLNLTYDPDVIEITHCAGRHRGTCDAAYRDDTVHVVRQGGGAVTGDTTLASITFRCLREGTSAADIEAKLLNDATLHPVSAVLAGGSATCAARAGDASCDGRTNAIDAFLIIQQISGFFGFLPCQAAADVNGDGLVRAVDATLILQFDAGLTPVLPAGAPAGLRDRNAPSW